MGKTQLQCNRKPAVEGSIQNEALAKRVGMRVIWEFPILGVPYLGSL